MNNYELKPLVGLIGLTLFAFVVYSLQSVSVAIKLAGAFSFLLFIIVTVYLFALIRDRRSILIYTAVVVLCFLDSMWSFIILGIITLIYVVGLLFKRVMGGKT